jgi:hypothetical protein
LELSLHIIEQRLFRWSSIPRSCAPQLEGRAETKVMRPGDFGVE